MRVTTVSAEVPFAGSAELLSRELLAGASEGRLGGTEPPPTFFESVSWDAERRRRRSAKLLSVIARHGNEFAARESERARETMMWGLLRRDLRRSSDSGAEIVLEPTPQQPPPESVDSGRAADAEVSLFWLRAGFAAFLLLFTGGLGLLSFVLETDAPALLRRLALVAMWAGPAAVAAAAHVHGLGTGVYLFGKRLSEVAAIFAVGMFVIAIVGTIEFSVR